MAEQSHRDEMNAAIRAQRERHAAPRTIAPAGAPAREAREEAAPGSSPAPEQPQEAASPRRSMLDRLRGR